jgi:hypothetical protein
MREALLEWEGIVAVTQGAYHDNLVFGPSPQHGRRQGHHESGHWKDRLPEVREDVAYLQRLAKEHGVDRDRPDYKLDQGPSGQDSEIDFAHQPIAAADPDRNLPVHAEALNAESVTLHYRRRDQTADWQSLPMVSDGNVKFRATIPGSSITPRWDLQYYFEARSKQGGLLWPSWEEGPPYYVVKVRRP